MGVANEPEGEQLMQIVPVTFGGEQSVLSQMIWFLKHVSFSKRVDYVYLCVHLHVELSREKGTTISFGVAVDPLFLPRLS